jgi:hypothetical protein
MTSVEVRKIYTDIPTPPLLISRGIEDMNWTQYDGLTVAGVTVPELVSVTWGVIERLAGVSGQRSADLPVISCSFSSQYYFIYFFRMK